MFTLTRLEFGRGKQKFILQGMTHFGPKSLFDEIQSDMDLLVAQGFQVFLEGYVDDRHDAMPDWQKRIVRYFDGILRWGRLRAKRENKERITCIRNTCSLTP